MKEGKMTLKTLRTILIITKTFLFIWLALLVVVMWFWWHASAERPGREVTVPPIRIITPLERRQAKKIECKYGLKGYTCVQDLQTGEINYYRRGEWETIAHRLK